MLSKSCLGLLALSANGALAANHRHAQRHLHANAKKDIVYETTTTTTAVTWETVTVDGNGDLIGGAKPTNNVEIAATPSVYTTKSHHYKPSAIPTTSSTPVAVPTTSSTSSASSSSSTYVAPAAPTTLVTSVATSAAAPATSAADTYVTPAAAVAEPVYTTSSTSSAAAATTADSTTTTSSGASKRGAAYNDASLVSILLGSGSKLSWGYNWGQVSDDLSSDLEFVPMLWGNKDNFFSTWSENAKSAIASGSKYVLSFNEPDNSGQANMDAATAASYHQQYMNPLSSSAKIGAPSVTNSNTAGESLDWLESWISACGGSCDFDFCPVHWYNTLDAGADDLFDFVTRASATCGSDKTVWLTEFAPNVGSPSQDQISEFLTTVQDAFDNNSTFSFLERYSYFYVADGMLVSGSSATTSGNTFAFA